MARRRLTGFLASALALGLWGCPEEDRGGRDDLEEQTTPRTEDEDAPAFPYDDGGHGRGGPGDTGTQGDPGSIYGPSPTQETGGPAGGGGSQGGAARSGEQGRGASPEGR